MVVLEWYYRHGVLYAQEHATVNDAIMIAGWGEEDGRISLQCIEAWEDDGTHRIIDADEALRVFVERKAERERVAEPLPIVATIKLRSPDGADARCGTYYALDEAQRDADRLIERLGDRVTLERQ